ncbi:hypothetical protein [Arcobacter sp. LA11]|uniref:hypothetical protein n=1 Tax=Arcobacter sp. LA11 TaxID=1898176 RepID=UPI000933CDC5|nr:hypothetical protein [Arcobacter sp. LA11]
MITSNINEILLSSQLNQNLTNNNKELFLDSLLNTKENKEKVRTSDLTFNNIKGISLEEIETLFDNQEDKDMAKNLRLTTLFTEDKYLANALFNTVLGKPFELGYSYLFDMYEDKNTFFNSKNNSLSDLLHKSMTRRFEEDDKKPSDKISQNMIDKVLLAVNSFNFISTLSNSYKDQYDKYKDDNEYSFLYNDYYLKYQELIYKYDEAKSIEESLISQFR